MKRLTIALLAASVAVAVLAQPAVDWTDGEVRKIDPDLGKITLKHGEIKSLDMPPMTMVFGVKDKALLGALKAGDQVRFKAIKLQGAYTVIEISRAP